MPAVRLEALVPMATSTTSPAAPQTARLPMELSCDGGERTPSGPFPHVGESTAMAKNTWRIVTRGTDGELLIRDFDSPEAILRTHLQVGTDDCSTDLELRGAPVFRSLVGPMPEGKDVIRYETPDVFELLTKEWALPRSPRRRTRKPAGVPASETPPTE